MLFERGVSARAFGGAKVDIFRGEGVVPVEVDSDSERGEKGGVGMVEKVKSSMS